MEKEPLKEFKITIGIDNFESPVLTIEAKDWKSVVDYVLGHIEIINTAPEILTNNRLLNFIGGFNSDSGEVVQQRHGYLNRIAIFKNLKIQLSTNLKTKFSTINITGSIHKYAQNNTNHQDFTFANVKDTINELCNTLHLNPSNCLLHHIEFGLNINPVHSTTDILNSIILCKGVDYTKKEFKNTGYLKEFEFSQYKIKIYDKAKQYDLNTDLLRFEVKATKMQYLQPKSKKTALHGLKSLKDLTNPIIYTDFLKVIISNIDNILFYDYRIEQISIASENDLFKLVQGANPQYWVKLKNKVSGNTYYKKKNEFENLVSKYAPTDLRTELKNIIATKWNYLLNTCTNLPLVENSKVVRIYTNIVSKNIQPPKYCLSCGKDISHQKSNSKYCRFKINGKENKDCKNLATNFFEHDLRLYPKHQLHLLEIDNYLQPDRLRLKQIEFKNYRSN